MKSAWTFLGDLRRRGVLQTAAVYVVASWIVLQAADVLFPGAGIPESAIGYVFIGVVLGFPLFITFGWQYDFVGGSIRRTPATGATTPDAPPLGRSDHVLLTGLALATAIIVATVSVKVFNEAEPGKVVAANTPVEFNSIAVLPFVNMSDDPANEYFGDGIAEELLNQLARLTSLKVAARTSSFSFKGKDETIKSIGEQLGVRTVLEGSVRKSGKKLRVTAQLIETENGYHLWSHTYDREIGDVFAIQEDIALAIAGALQIKVLSDESQRIAVAATENVDAYDFLLLGRFYRSRRNPEALAKSIEHFNSALQLDGRFALAYAELAATHVYQHYHGNLQPEQVQEIAGPLVEESLHLDPDLAEAHWANGAIRLILEDYPAATAALQRAVDLRPSYSGAWTTLGFSYVLQGRLHDAAEAYEKADSLDPLEASVKFNIGALKMLTGKYEDGHAALQKVKKLAPERTGVEGIIVHWANTYGRYDIAAHWIGRLEQTDPLRAAMSRITLYENLGLWDEAWRAIEAAQQLGTDDDTLVHYKMHHHFLTGDHTRFAQLARQEYEKIDTLGSTRYSPSDKLRYFYHGRAALMEDNYLQAVDDLTMSAGGEEGIENAVYDDITMIKYAALAHRRLGQHEKAEQLLTHCLDLATRALQQGWNTPTIHYRTAQVHSLLGDADKAIAELKLAVDSGMRTAATLEREPLWSDLRDDVRFQSIVANVNSDLVAQREAIALMLDQPGDPPPPEVQR